MRRPRILAPLALLVAVSLGAAPAAFAQGRERPAPRAENVTTYGEGSFEPSAVEGTVHRPDHDLVRALRVRALGSLIRVRTNFDAELKKSVERQ